jgi:AraC-like DNA-binding protein
VDRVNYTEEEKRKLAQRVGMSEQQVQDLFQQEDGVYRLYDGEEDVVEDDIINNE